MNWSQGGISLVLTRSLTSNLRKKEKTPCFSMLLSGIRSVCLSIVFTHDWTLKKRRRNSLFKSITEVSEPLNVQDDVYPCFTFRISDAGPGSGSGAFVCLFDSCNAPFSVAKRGLVYGEQTIVNMNAGERERTRGRGTKERGRLTITQLQVMQGLNKSNCSDKKKKFCHNHLFD